MTRFLMTGLLIVGMAAGGLAPTPTLAQSTVNFADDSNWLVGYVAAPPRQMAGFGTSFTRGQWNGWGLMADVRWTLDSPARGTFFADRTPDQADQEGDVFNLEENAWTSVGAAAVKGVTPELAVYLGGGVSWRTAYIRYFDQTRERGDLGFYWVEDAAESRSFPNVQGGAFFRLGHRLVIQAGGQTAPAGFVFGGHLRVL